MQWLHFGEFLLVTSAQGSVTFDWNSSLNLEIHLGILMVIGLGDMIGLNKWEACTTIFVSWLF
jgi:hypothetical protein